MCIFVYPDTSLCIITYIVVQIEWQHVLQMYSLKISLQRSKCPLKSDQRGKKSSSSCVVDIQKDCFGFALTDMLSSQL